MHLVVPARHTLQIVLAATILTASMIASFAIIASAESEADIVFPIAELDNCANETECRAYCDEPEHTEVCIAFAERHNLISKEEAEHARKFSEIGVGPGGCQTKDACEAYCDNINNIDECLAFAEGHGLIDDDELREAKRVAAALKSGAELPGGCQNKNACEAYCENPDHMPECIAFAEKAGLMSPEELKEAKKVLQALESGVPFPGNCRGKDECEAYCQEASHMEECLAFAEAAGFIPSQEVEQARKMMEFMQRGEMPGNCRSKRECERYCKAEEHLQECMEFAVKTGMMTPEEFERFQKTGGKGPGGCVGREECEAFCNNPENQQACFEFAKEHDLVPEEELQNMEVGVQRFREGIEQAPPEVQQCLQDTIGENVLNKIKEGTFMPTPELGEHMHACFEEFMPGPPTGESGEFHESGEGFEGLGGPGGCTSAEECMRYCSDPAHLEECRQFMPPEENMPPSSDNQLYEEHYEEQADEFNQIYDQREAEIIEETLHETIQDVPQEYQQYSEEEYKSFIGPGGCTNSEECTRYCADPNNIEECRNFLNNRYNPTQPLVETPSVINTEEQSGNLLRTILNFFIR